MKYRVYISNSAEYEWVLAQKVLFVLGYTWPGRNVNINRYWEEYQYIHVWDDGEITRDDRNERNMNTLTFDEFIGYIDINDIRYGN